MKQDMLKIRVFFNVVPCSLVDRPTIFWEELAASILRYKSFLNLIMDAQNSSEIFIPIYHTIWCHVICQKSVILILTASRTPNLIGNIYFVSTWFSAWHSRRLQLILTFDAKIVRLKLYNRVNWKWRYIVICIFELVSKIFRNDVKCLW
jgi:hypothetical protein